MYRIRHHGTGRFIAETADAKVLDRLVRELAGAMPPRFWVAMATTRFAVATASNPGFQTIDVTLEAF